jgi:hypothetical protein
MTLNATDHRLLKLLGDVTIRQDGGLIDRETVLREAARQGIEEKYCLDSVKVLRMRGYAGAGTAADGSVFSVELTESAFDDYLSEHYEGLANVAETVSDWLKFRPDTNWIEISQRAQYVGSPECVVRRAVASLAWDSQVELDADGLIITDVSPELYR